MLSNWPMQSTPNFPFQVFQDLELDPGNVEFAIRRIEPLSPSGLSSAMTAHRHDFYEIVWVTQGQGTISIDLDRYPIQPNTLCLVAPGQVHAWEVETSPSGFVLGFTHRFFAESPDDAFLWFFLGGIRDNDSALLYFLLLDRFNQNTVAEGFYI